MLSEVRSALPTDWRREAVAIAGIAVAALAYYVSPNLPLAALASGVLLYLIWRRLDLGLMFVLVTAPFYRFPKALDMGTLGKLAGREQPLEISLAEYALLLCVAAWLFRHAFLPPRDRVTGHASRL